MNEYEVTHGDEPLSVWVEAENHQEAIEEAMYIIEETEMMDLHSFEITAQ